MVRLPRFSRLLVSPLSPVRPGMSRAFLVCLVISGAMWLVLTLQKQTRALVTAPLDVTSVAPGRGLVDAPPRRVEVTVEGEGFRLLPLIARPPALTVSAQTDKVTLLDALGDLGGGVRVVDVTPSTINLTTAPLVTRRVPVRLAGRLAFAPTFDLVDSVRLFPDSLTVTGAAPVVERLAFWPTVPVALRDLRDTVVANVALSDTLAGLVRVPTRLVRLVVPVAAFTGAARDIEVRVRGVPPGAARISPDPATLQVHFRVRLGQYEAAMRATDFYADVTYGALVGARSGRVFPQLRLPAGLTVRDVTVSPGTVGYYTLVE